MYMVGNTYKYKGDDYIIVELCSECGEPSSIMSIDDDSAITFKRHINCAIRKKLLNISFWCEKYDRYTFKNAIFGEGEEEKKKIYRQVYEYCKDIKSQKKGFIFQGKERTGKTHLSCCAANFLKEKGHTVITMTFSHYLKRCTAFEKDAEGNTIDFEKIFFSACMQADVIIIDDVGTEKMTEKGYEYIYNLTDFLDREEKIVIMSTNLYTEQMKEKYADRGHKRITARWNEMCDIIIFDKEAKK